MIISFIICVLETLICWIVSGVVYFGYLFWIVSFRICFCIGSSMLSCIFCILLLPTWILSSFRVLVGTLCIRVFTSRRSTCSRIFWVCIGGLVYFLLLLLVVVWFRLSMGIFFRIWHIEKLCFVWHCISGIDSICSLCRLGCLVGFRYLSRKFPSIRRSVVLVCLQSWDWKSVVSGVVRIFSIIFLGRVWYFCLMCNICWGFCFLGWYFLLVWGVYLLLVLVFGCLFVGFFLVEY